MACGDTKHIRTWLCLAANGPYQFLFFLSSNISDRSGLLVDAAAADNASPRCYGCILKHLAMAARRQCDQVMSCVQEINGPACIKAMGGELTAASYLSSVPG